MVKVEVLKMFVTSDGTGQVEGRKGDVIEVTKSTAERLIEQGLVKKYRRTKSEDK